MIRSIPVLLLTSAACGQSATAQQAAPERILQGLGDYSRNGRGWAWEGEAIPLVRGKPGRPKRKPFALVADRGYDSDPHRELLRKMGINPVIARRYTEHGSGLGILRWVVERTISWLHQERRELVGGSSTTRFNGVSPRCTRTTSTSNLLRSPRCTAWKYSMGRPSLR